MCGIVAIYAYGSDGSPVDTTELLRIRDHMRARGPDGAGHWIAPDRRVGLAHRRLAIIDLSQTGSQPMAGQHGATCITFNGEIYNYRELRRELEQRGRVFVSDSDTEVLLHAYDEFGTDMVRRLRGMYAFALWDQRRRGLLLARDPFGIKPLYVADDGRRIVVASQVKALLRADTIATDPDPAGKVSFLVLGSILEPFTLFRAIRAVPAGSTVWIDANGAQAPEVFWSLTDVLRTAEAKAAGGVDSSRDRSRRLRDALIDSIRHHMVADVPVGVFLSAGIDSTTLIALADEAGFPGLNTTTLGFDAVRDTPHDEVALAETIAASHGSTHQSRWIGVESFAAERNRLLTAMDQPTVDGINVYFVAQAAAQSGVKVALSGLGGDEMFSGYPSFRQIPRLVRWLGPLAGVPGFGRGFRRLSAPLLKRLTSPKYASLFEYGDSIEDAYLLRRGLYLPWELPEVMDPEEARQGWADLSLQARLRECTRGLATPTVKVASLEMLIYMRNQLLRDSDWAGMAHSLEIRLPFVDSNLVETLALLMVGDHPIDKRALAGTLERGLPEAILTRPKTGFSVPVRQWLMADRSSGAAHEDRGLRGWAKVVLNDQEQAVGRLRRWAA